jgi:hypothetical protein
MRNLLVLTVGQLKYLHKNIGQFVSLSQKSNESLLGYRERSDGRMDKKKEWKRNAEGYRNAIRRFLLFL